MEPDLEGRLITAAARLLDADGLEAVGIREVARRCDVSHGAPRRYFPSLAALLSAVAERGFDDLRGVLNATDRTPLAQARAYVRFAVERPHTFDLLTRHDLLGGSGRGLRRTSLPALHDWVEIYRSSVPGGTTNAGVAAWAAVHGVATIASRQVPTMLDLDAETLLDEVLRGMIGGGRRGSDR